VNLPEPQTAQLNRFYTREFFAEAAGKLNPGGLFSFRLRGAEDYISPDLGDFLRCINNTLRSVFTDIVLIPGETVHFSAANRPGMLTVDSETLLGRLRERHIKASYVREYYLPFRLMPDRIREVERELQSHDATPVNRDLSLAAYYFGVTLWSTNFGVTYQPSVSLHASLLPPSDDAIEARFYDKLATRSVQCRLCPRQCVVANGRRGYCNVRENHGGNGC
jgi:spermidine synthase